MFFGIVVIYSMVTSDTLVKCWIHWNKWIVGQWKRTGSERNGTRATDQWERAKVFRYFLHFTFFRIASKATGRAHNPFAIIQDSCSNGCFWDSPNSVKDGNRFKLVETNAISFTITQHFDHRFYANDPETNLWIEHSKQELCWRNHQLHFDSIVYWISASSRVNWFDSSKS